MLKRLNVEVERDQRKGTEELSLRIVIEDRDILFMDKETGEVFFSLDSDGLHVWGLVTDESIAKFPTVARKGQRFIKTHIN